VGSLSSSFRQLNIPLAAFMEREELLAAFLSHPDLHPAAQSAGLFEDREWEKWTFPKGCIIILVGAPPCTSVSVAGKGLASKDPTSLHLSHHIEIAEFFCADFVLLENVPQLVRGDAEHGLYSNLLAITHAAGFAVLDLLFLRDSCFGGSTQRERIFLLLESSRAAALLRAWVTPDLARFHREPSPLSSILMDISQLPDSVHLPGTFHNRDFLQDSLDADDSPSRAMRIGSLEWESPFLCVGSLVMLKPPHSHTGWNRWRVMDLTPTHLRVMRAQRSRPDSRWITSSEVRSTLEQRIPVYSALRPGVTIRHWGEPPLGNTFAVLRPGPVVTTLAPLEAWRAQGLTDDHAAALLEVGGTSAQLSAAAGNSIAKCSADLVAGLLSQRAFSLQARLTLPCPQDAWQCALESVPTDSLRVVLIPFKLGTPPCFFVSPVGPHVIAALVPAQGRGHGAAHRIANGLAAAVFGDKLVSFLAGRLEGSSTLVFALPISADQLPQTLWIPQSNLPSCLQLWCSLTANAVITLLPPPPLTVTNLSDPLGVSAALWQQAQLTAVSQVAYTGRSKAVEASARSVVPTGQSEGWLLNQRHLIELTNQQLRQDIVKLAESADVEPSITTSLLSWADAIVPVPWAEIPPGLHTELDEYTDSSLALLLIPEPCPPHHTSWLPRLQQPAWVKGFNPTRIEHLLTKEALLRIQAWVTEQLRYLNYLHLGRTPQTIR
jgi:site-specific DNA-cytosine methylase